MTRCNRQAGFVLLMTLALVLLAGGLLSGLAMRSASAALDARSAVERLQRRWAVTTCRATLLENVERVLDEAERGGEERDRRTDQPEDDAGKPVAMLRTHCRLAGLDYELVFTDEQAKLNVNNLLGRETRDSARRVIERLIRDTAGARDEAVEVKLYFREESGSRDEDQFDLKVGGYDQVFDNVLPGQLIGGASDEGMAGRVTCWGDGKVSVRRASDEVLRQACSDVLSRGELDMLIDARKDHWYQKVNALLSRVARIDLKTRNTLNDMLTDDSTAHGLWVIERGRQRSWYTLAVGIGTAGQRDPESGVPGKVRVSKYYEFQW